MPPPAPVEKMIRTLVARYASRNPVVRAHRDDVLQEARLAAWVASERFDPSRGVKIETFLSRRVHGAIQDWLRNGGASGATGAAVGAATRRGDLPERFRFAVSLEAERPDGSRVYDLTDPTGGELLDLVEARDDVRALVERHGRRDVLIALLSLGYGVRMRRVGDHLDLSESRISQIVTRLKREVRAREPR